MRSTCAEVLVSLYSFLFAHKGMGVVHSWLAFKDGAGEWATPLTSN